MDSKTVNRHIRTSIWPVLKEAGFSTFTSRSAWRYRDEKVDVINFQSFNAYLAESLGCTTYSFTLNLGCYFHAVPEQFQPGMVKQRNGQLCPEEYMCHLRRTLRKGLRQPELRRRDIWYVDPEGENLERIMADVERAIVKQALPWFENYEDLRRVLRVLRRGEERQHGTFGFGANPSPMRSFLSGFIALRLGETRVAQQGLQAALDSGLFANNESDMRAALERLASK
jgi:hypothetical protein